MGDPTKPYLLTFTEYSNYIRADLTADTISEEIIRGYVAEIVAKSNEAGKHRILLYRDIPASMSEGEMFHTVSESLEALRGKKLALVNPHAAIESELKFGLTVGQNRGGNYASFDNIDDAETWLLERGD